MLSYNQILKLLQFYKYLVPHTLIHTCLLNVIMILLFISIVRNHGKHGSIQKNVLKGEGTELGIASIKMQKHRLNSYSDSITRNFKLLR